jgi:SAM-dependent MidA family methyltransferase
MNTTTLPKPEAHALAHSEQLLALIGSEIRTHGPMRFDTYWERALYHPGLGYYSAGAQKFGAAGDFVTAPELGSVFARCLAVQSAQILTDLGGGDILELGAGSGVLCVELLLALEQRQQLPRRYRILERSADLRQRQQALVEQRCPHLGGYIDWVDQPP